MQTNLTCSMYNILNKCKTTNYASMDPRQQKMFVGSTTNTQFLVRTQTSRSTTGTGQNQHPGSKSAHCHIHIQYRHLAIALAMQQHRHPASAPTQASKRAQAPLPLLEVRAPIALTIWRTKPCKENWNYSNSFTVYMCRKKAPEILQRVRCLEASLHFF